MNPFLSTKAGAAHNNFEITELLKFSDSRVVEIGSAERENPSLDMLLENE